MDKSVWLRYDKVDRGTWLASRSHAAVFQLNSTRSFEECATTTLHLLSVQRTCERLATKITLLPTCTSELCFFSRSRAPLMSQDTHLSLRLTETIYLRMSEHDWYLSGSRSVMS